MMRQIGDFPLWAIVCGFLPAVVVFWLGIGYAGTFLVYLGITAVLAILNQLDRIERELQRLGGRAAGAGED